MSAEQQAGAKRRSSRASQERSKRRRRSRTSAKPQVAETTQANASATQPELSRSEARRQAKTEASRPQSRSGSVFTRVISSERAEGLRKFIRETMAEIKKVVWPDRETTRNLTLLVIALSLVLGIVLGGLDYILFEIFEAL